MIKHSFKATLHLVAAFTLLNPFKCNTAGVAFNQHRLQFVKPRAEGLLVQRLCGQIPPTRANLRALLHCCALPAAGSSFAPQFLMKTAENGHRRLVWKDWSEEEL